MPVAASLFSVHFDVLGWMNERVNGRQICADRSRHGSTRRLCPRGFDNGRINVVRVISIVHWCNVNFVFG